MRSRNRRRSVSSCVSPGPRRPIPPFCRSRWVQPRTSRVRHMTQLRQFDLQLAFVGTRALREDIEDQTGAVDARGTAEHVRGCVPARASDVIEHHQIGACSRTDRSRISARACRCPRNVAAPAEARCPMTKRHRIAAGGQQPIPRVPADLRARQRPRAPGERVPLAHPRRGARRTRIFVAGLFVQLIRRPPASAAPGAREPPWRWRACRPSG